MATTGYRHGIYTSEKATSILPARTVDSAVVFAVGTAPVHLLAEGTPRPVNVPQLFYSYDDFVKSMGWDTEHFSDYSLQELIYSHFALYRGAERRLREVQLTGSRRHGPRLLDGVELSHLFELHGHLSSKSCVLCMKASKFSILQQVIFA